jgi:hypothetical protein
MSHHKTIKINGVRYGHFRITNDGEILSIWIHQPWGTSELFIPQSGLRDEEE